MLTEEEEAQLVRISVDPDVCFGKPCVRGTRVRVIDVIGLLSTGMTHKQIIKQYPFIKLADIRACCLYACHVISKRRRPRRA